MSFYDKYSVFVRSCSI